MNIQSTDTFTSGEVWYNITIPINGKGQNNGYKSHIDRRGR